MDTEENKTGTPGTAAEPLPTPEAQPQGEPEAADEPQETDTPSAPEPAKKPKHPRWVKILLGVVVALLALVGVAAAYINGKLDLLRYSDGSIASAGTIDQSEDQDLDATGLTHNTDAMEMPEGSPFADEDVLNILLIGTDERTEAVNDADAFTHLNQLDGTADTTEFSEDARADAMILVSLNIKEHTIKLVSIERGTGVPILLDGYEDQYDWITHTFRYGGAKLTMDTVEDCFNVQVDHYVRVNFNSFVQIVDAVGGVDIEITELEAKALNWEVPSNSMLIVNHVDAGLNHFDGYTALQYARLRKIDNDWKRIERQRTVISAVLDAVKNASVTELDTLLNTVLPLVQTNFTKSEIAALLTQLPGFLGCEVQQMSMPIQGTYGVRTGMDDRLMYDPDWAVNIKALQDFLYNGQTAEEVIAATPETAAAEAAGEQIYATRETAKAENPNAAYYKENLQRVYLDDGFDAGLLYTAADTTSTETTDTTETTETEAAEATEDTATYTAPAQAADVYLVGLSGNRDAEIETGLARTLYTQGVRTIAVPEGPAAGVLLNAYLQTGRADALTGYLNTLPAAERESAKAQWQALYASYPGLLHAVGLGKDKFNAVIARAVSLLAETAAWPADEISEALTCMRGTNRANALYWFKWAMANYPQQMEECFGSNYTTLLRLYQGTLTSAGQTELLQYDIDQALEADPEAKLLAFVPDADALRTDGSLSTQLTAQLAEQGKTLCVVATVFGTWGYDGTFAAADDLDLWDDESLGTELGDTVTPGADYLLTLRGTGSPYTESTAFLQNGDAPAADRADALLIVSKKSTTATKTSG